MEPSPFAALGAVAIGCGQNRSASTTDLPTLVRTVDSMALQCELQLEITCRREHNTGSRKIPSGVLKRLLFRRGELR